MIKCLSQIALISLLSYSPFSLSQQENEKHSTNNNMMNSVIVTLAIPEQNKNSSDAIATAQDKLLQALELYETENITRYRFSPIIALSIDQAGLEILKTLENITSITKENLHQTQNTPQPETSSKTNNPPCENE